MKVSPGYISSDFNTTKNSIFTAGEEGWLLLITLRHNFSVACFCSTALLWAPATEGQLTPGDSLSFGFTQPTFHKWNLLLSPISMLPLKHPRTMQTWLNATDRTLLGIWSDWRQEVLKLFKPSKKYHKSSLGKELRATSPNPVLCFGLLLWKSFLFASKWHFLRQCYSREAIRFYKVLLKITVLFFKVTIYLTNEAMPLLLLQLGGFARSSQEAQTQSLFHTLL